VGGLTAAGPGESPFGSSTRAAGRLLSVARGRESIERNRNPFPPLAYLLLNSLLCAFAQQYITDDPGGVYLPLFLVVEWSAGIIITLSFAGGTGAVILRNSRLFHGSATAGYYFLLAGTMRRPEWYLFTAIGCLFPAALFARGIFSFAGIALLSAVPVLVLQVFCCAATVRALRATRPLTGFVLLTVVATAAVVASVFVFRSAALATAVPMAGWTASGIVAFSEGDAATGARSCLYLAVTLAAVVGIFRK